MMLVVFVLIVAGSIAAIVSARRNEYRPKPLQYVSRAEDYANSRFVCPIHDHYFGHTDVTCPLCDMEYHNDINAGVYPPGNNEGNKQFYYVEDWIELRKIDLLWQSGKITEQEAVDRKKAYIRNTIPKRIAVATGTDPDIQRVKIEANQRRLRNYAGAAQYSGITPK